MRKRRVQTLNASREMTAAPRSLQAVSNAGRPLEAFVIWTNGYPCPKFTNESMRKAIRPYGVRSAHTYAAVC
jgi:hypothetical protein